MQAALMQIIWAV